jgi:hypothetical protein
LTTHNSKNVLQSAAIWLVTQSVSLLDVIILNVAAPSLLLKLQKGIFSHKVVGSKDKSNIDERTR